jgi:hypothetical protein
MPFILSTFADKDGVLKAVVVDDTLYCGICKPQETPITLKGLA